MILNKIVERKKESLNQLKKRPVLLILKD